MVHQYTTNECQSLDNQGPTYFRSFICHHSYQYKQLTHSLTIHSHFGCSFSRSTLQILTGPFHQNTETFFREVEKMHDQMLLRNGNIQNT